MKKKQKHHSLCSLEDLENGFKNAYKLLGEYGSIGFKKQLIENISCQLVPPRSVNSIRAYCSNIDRITTKDKPVLLPLFLTEINLIIQKNKIKLDIEHVNVFNQLNKLLNENN